MRWVAVLTTLDSIVCVWMWEGVGVMRTEHDSGQSAVHGAGRERGWHIVAFKRERVLMWSMKTYAAAIEYEHAHGKWRTPPAGGHGERGARGDATYRAEVSFSSRTERHEPTDGNVDKIAHKTGHTEEAKITYL